ncbi:hypothetical protein Tco_0066545 [Tanacetum coccineum]
MISIAPRRLFVPPEKHCFITSTIIVGEFIGKHLVRLLGWVMVLGLGLGLWSIKQVMARLPTRDDGEVLVEDGYGYFFLNWFLLVPRELEDLSWRLHRITGQSIWHSPTSVQLTVCERHLSYHKVTSNGAALHARVGVQSCPKFIKGLGTLSFGVKIAELSESVNDHPNCVIALRRLRKLRDKIHSDVFPASIGYLGFMYNNPEGL